MSPETSDICWFDYQNETATEGVKGLLLINGGGAVALLALLADSWKDKAPFLPSVIAGILLMSLGVVAGASAYLLRVQTSKAFQYEKPSRKRWAIFSQGVQIASLSLFALGVSVVAIGMYNGLQNPALPR